MLTPLPILKNRHNIIVRMKILISTLVRNNEKWIPMFYNMCESIKNKRQDINFDIHVYENDSTDSTKTLLKGTFISQNFGDSSTPYTRTKRLSKYRNDIKNHIRDLDSYDYVLMIDSNIIFGTHAFDVLFNTLQLDRSIAMATPHSLVGTSVPCEFYYDTFAMGLGQFDSAIECGYEGARHDRHCHRVTHEWPKNFRRDSNIIDVKRCFGGFVLIRTKAYKHSTWGINNAEDCEHWQFCADVRKYGKIVINRDARVLWYE